LEIPNVRSLLHRHAQDFPIPGSRLNLHPFVFTMVGNLNANEAESLVYVVVKLM
jgi:hypothetical protein